jgi:hypothetical protein
MQSVFGNFIPELLHLAIPGHAHCEQHRAGNGWARMNDHDQGDYEYVQTLA